jgi:hypothetical protein
MPLPSYYHSDPNLNLAVNGINIGENMARADVNNALRQIMADIKDWTDSLSISVPVTIAEGGTGQTDAVAALAALGGLGVAYQHLPQTVKSAAFSFAPAQDGGHIRYTGAAAAATIDPNATTAFGPGSVILVVNDGTGALTVTRGTGVALIWASSGADANRALAVGGMAMLINVATDRWFISGAGLS